jgi:hypothetical protein
MASIRYTPESACGLELIRERRNMAKLWGKGYPTDPEIERFTVGEDYLLDACLVRT